MTSTLRTTALTLPKHIFNQALYTRLQNVWFDGIPAASVTAGGAGVSIVPPEEVMKRWFSAGTAEEQASFDRTCHAEFGPALDSLAPANFPIPPADSYEAEKMHWETVAAPFVGDCTVSAGAAATSGGSKEGERAANNALSMIILLDQMPRNIFREKQSVIYSHYDRIARSLLHTLLKRDSAQRPDLHPSLRMALVHRLWFYMPLMHSEHLEDHAKYDEMLGACRKEAEEKGAKDAVEYIDRSLDFEKKHVDILKEFGRYPHRNEHLGRKNTPEEQAYLEGGGETFTSKKKE